MDSGNIGFVLLCAAFVFVMTPGLAMFYGGLVRKKNVVNTMMTSILLSVSELLCGCFSVIRFRLLLREMLYR